MTPGKFWDSFQQAAAFLRDVKLWKGSNPHKNCPYSTDCKDYSRSEDYQRIYNSLGDLCDYDIILKDNSYFQMCFEGGESRLVFIQCPTEYVSFKEFLKCVFNTKIDDDFAKYCREDYDNDYNQFLSEQKINTGAVYMRYDVDGKGREGNENIHAYTHLHVGLNNNIRIPIGVHITPLVFVMFVVRHVYYDIWASAVRKGKTKTFLNAKSQCEELDASVWSSEEKNALFLI